MGGRLACGVAAAVSAAVAACQRGPSVPHYGIDLLNNSGATVYHVGVQFAARPVEFGRVFGDGGLAGYGYFPDPVPTEGRVFWEAPEGTRHERAVAVARHCPAAGREYFNISFLLRADGEVEVVVRTRSEEAAAGWHVGFAELRRRGRPADKPDPPPLGG